MMVRFACLYNALIYLGAGCFSVYYMVAYHDVGLSVLLISIVNVVFDVSESASELPTSVLFDRWSRERTLIIGVLCRVAGFILMLFWSTNFAVLCLANVLAGIGAAVESGAASSLYIEYARKHDPSLGMKTLVSRLSAMIGVCTICGGAVGAVLFLLDSQLIWLGAMVFYVLAIIPLLGLMRAGSRTKAAATDGSGTTERQAEASVESDGSAEPGESGTSLTVLDHVRQTVAAAAVLLRKPEIWNMVVFNLGTLSVLTFWQLLLMGHQTGVWWQFAGLVFTNIAQIVGSRLGMLRLHPRSGDIAILVLIVSAVMLAATPMPAVRILAFFVFSCAQMYVANTISSSLHESIDDSIRATAFSVGSLVLMAFTAVVTPLCGYIADTFSISWGTLTTIPLLVALLIAGLARKPESDKRVKVDISLD